MQVELVDVIRWVQVVLVVLAILFMLWATRPYKAQCGLCKKTFKDYDMAHHKVCMDCWYSDDEETQDRAFELATGYKYDE